MCPNIILVRPAFINVQASVHYPISSCNHLFERIRRKVINDDIMLRNIAVEFMREGEPVELRHLLLQCV